MDYNRVQEYTATTPDRIRQAVEKVQAKARARLLTRQTIDEVIREIEAHPYGCITADGGSVPRSYKYRAETTFFSAAWYTWRHKKWIIWFVIRDDAGKVSYGSSGDIDKRFDKKEAWEIVFTERYNKYRSIKTKRKAKSYGIILPKDREYRGLLDAEAGMVLVETVNGSHLLCSALGHIEAPPDIKTVYQAAKKVGIPLPNRKEARTWQKVEPYWVMAVLAK